MISDANHSPRVLPATLRRCKQCYALKRMDCFFNKNRTGYCVICDRCRMSQRRRYYRTRFVAPLRIREPGKEEATATGYAGGLP